jgi:hypothetical protein
VTDTAGTLTMQKDECTVSGLDNVGHTMLEEVYREFLILAG